MKGSTKLLIPILGAAFFWSAYFWGDQMINAIIQDPLLFFLIYLATSFSLVALVSCTREKVLGIEEVHDYWWAYICPLWWFYGFKIWADNNLTD